ncbi:hypothetical protein [Amycolatopsis sp. NPDC059657]|uniref:hypothetical protein n=1 Tax=Amycolatopsis sp. NPDC059657 TaxID=3346899 RepID=UPI0036704094
MFARILWAALTVFLACFTLIGAVTTSLGALLGWSILGFAIGVLAWQVAPHVPVHRVIVTDAPHAWIGAAAAAAVLAGCLAIAGMSGVFGGTVTAWLLVIFAAAAVWRHGRRSRRGVRPSVSTPREPPAVPRLMTGVSTEELCVAWRRSYFQLQQAADDTVRRQVILDRQGYLDELDRRDRDGFLRWLDSGARAAGDPSRYLTAEG